jgi:hypothetical protein
MRQIQPRRNDACSSCNAVGAGFPESNDIGFKASKLWILALAAFDFGSRWVW